MGKRLGRYDVIRTLARGSLTDLLLGRASGEAGFQRHVAIKQLREEHAQDAACLEMFVNEARLAAALHHHNIVQVLDIGDDAGKPYFAMEYVHGVDLRSLLTHLGKRGEQLPLQHVVSIIASAAAALHHAHEQKGPDGAPLGIVHRQVTPANVLVGFDGNVKLVDFGIAKAAIKRIQTGVGVLKGSAPYMAPEQCAGRTVDRRSDIFALGIVLYELATVRRLFKGENEFLTMSAVVNAEVPRPSQYRRDVPPDLEVVMLKALARDPLARYQTAGDMANALDKVARSVGVGASTTALANYLKLQFGERKEPWLENKPEMDPEATQVDFDGGASGLAPPPSEALKSNAIPKMVAATKSSPIMKARTVVLNPAGSASMTVPMDKSFSVATTVDEIDPEPASSRMSTEVGDEEEPRTDVNAVAEPAFSAKKTVPDKPKPFSTVAVKVPPSAPPPTPSDKPATNANARTIALVTTPTAERPSAPALPAPPAPPSNHMRTAVGVPPAPVLGIESSKPAVARDAQLTDATAIVEPLAVVVARAQTSSVKTSSKKVLYIAGGVAVLLVLVVAIVMWPSSSTLDTSAAPVAKAEPPPEPEPEPAKDEGPPKSAMEMTARDYDEARDDGGVAAVEDDAAVVAATPDAAEPDAAVVAVAEPDPKAETAPEDLAVPVDDEPVTAEKPVAAKTAKRTTVKKTPAKRTTPAKKTATKKTATKKTTKPKWNPDDLFLGE